MSVFSTTGTACPSDHDRIFTGDWSGTVTGCNCPSGRRTTSYYCRKARVSTGLSKGSCSTNQTRCGCSTVSSVSASDFWLWPTNNRYCAQRDQRISYSNTFMNMNTDGSCKSNFKQCGSSTSRVKKGICIPKNYSCPLTSIKIASNNPDSSKYSLISGRTLNLYYSNDQSFGNPLMDLIVREDHVCVGEHHRGITPGRKDYKLMTNPADPNCTKDSRYSEVGESVGELDLLNSNNVHYGGLPMFQTSNQYQWKKFSRNIVEFDPRCNAYVIPIIAINSTIQSIFAWMSKFKVKMKN